MTSLSVLYPGQPGGGAAVAAFAGFVQRAHAARLWLGQSLRAETHQVLAFLAGAGVRVPTGTSVALMPLRHAFDAALQARSLAALTGRPVVAGIGASAPDVVRALNGAPYTRPASAVREYLTTMRTLLDGGELRGLRLPPLRHPGVEVGAGVLRPAMARVAGACADVAITWLTPPGYVRDYLVPQLRAGAGDDRPAPRVVTVVHVAPQRTGRDPVRLAYLGAGQHLRAAHYVDMLRRSGLSVDAGNPAAGARALVEAGLFVSGPPAAITDRLREYAAAGVDEIVLNPAGLLLAEGEQAAADGVAEILQTWGGDDGNG